MKTALIVIDMLKDFMRGGVLSNEEADEIVPNIQSLLTHARKEKDWVVVYSNDSHLENDREMRIWGPHAMRGTEGAKVTDKLRPQPGPQEWEEPKQFYGAFDGTNLARKLKEMQVDTVCLTGQHTNCCVRHTAYGCFRSNFEIIVPRDAVVAFNEDNNTSLEYLKNIYGANITSTSDILTPAQAAVHRIRKLT